jgi:hypothetical protein
MGRETVVIRGRGALMIRRGRHSDQSQTDIIIRGSETK